jgi:hypothetical protein
MRRGIAAAAALTLTLLLAPSAHAAYEQVGCFAGHFPGLTDSCKPVPEAELKAEGFKFGEEVQLAGVGGMAVNYTGAGGVPAGTVYAATREFGSPPRVAMFTPGTPPASELTFSLSWEITTSGGPYGRCGPALGSTCPPQVGGTPARVDVDVDPTTGNVYVSESVALAAGKKYIMVYTPDGSEEITRFGERIEGGKTADTPEKLHTPPQAGAIAVNGAGEVYVFDVNNFDDFYHRLMKFVPKVPGKYDAYEYAGAAEDIGAAFSGEGQPAKPVLDAAGNIYVSSLESSIEMYVPTASPGDPPVCRFTFAKGGITAITVNPKSGTPFFFSYKVPKRLFQLGACNPATGKFEGSGGQAIIGETQVAPQRDDLWGLAFDPVRKLTGRPAGVLYAGAPSNGPSSGVGKGEEGQSSLGYVFAQPVLEANPPQVLSQSASGVTATTAQLHAEGNPGGFETTYRFQYETEAEYEANPPEERFAGAAEAPVGGAILGTDKEALAAAAQLNGLAPDTAYRYRVLLESECSPAEPGQICEVPGAAQAFRTFASTLPGLPDDRAYELVSPAQKNGGQVLPAEPHISSCGFLSECKPGGTYEHYPMPSSPNGDAVAYQGTNFGGGVGATIENAYVARRTESGWVSVNPTPSLLQKAAPGYLAYDPSLTEAVFGQLYLALGSAPSEYTNLYAQPTTSPFAVDPLVAAQPPNRPGSGSGEFKLSFAGASKDLSRVFFEANDALTEETSFAPAAVDGGAAKFNLYEWERATGQLRLVNVAPGNATTAAGASFGVASANTVSADGSRAFFSDATGQVYVREGAEVTVAIPGSGAAAKFLSASTDGSRVLLTDGSLYDLESEETTDLTEGQGGFGGIAGQSDDLSSVYFVDTEVLTGEEANSEGEKAQAGKPNLYTWEGVGSTRYVATLSPEDNIGVSRSWSHFPFARTAQASPAGRYLAFLSEAPLTGFDNEGPCGVNGETGEFVEAPCQEAYLYDSATGELSCPSCNPSGTASLGRSALRRIKAPGAGPSPLPQPRYLLDSGRLYFDSRESLSLADSNEGVEDVYQYEPEGVGTCERQSGCVSLISAGTGTVDSNLLAVDETGKSAFFTTRDQLVIKDKDELIDLYVAREDGGIPAETETLPGECQGEACQPPVSAPNDPTPGSASFQGAGNVVEGAKPRPRCPKGKARRKGRCVAKKHKQQQQRKHHKRAKHERGGTR